MTTTTENNKRIAKNTLLLSLRMLLIIVINLFAVRIILDALGVEDYGIYNVVGGVVTLFSFLSGSLSSGAQRFLAFEIGRKDYESLGRVFSMTIIVFLGIAFLLFILVETLGVWFLNNKMTIPENRLVAANWVFQFSVLTFLMNIMIIPYNAAIIAWEKMSFFAYISIVEASSKLLCVFALLWFNCDKLILYAALICIISVVLFAIYQQYGKHKLTGCAFKWQWDGTLCKSLITYSGWNMMGTIAYVLRNQGTNILLNLFFNPIVNAAHAIGQQVNGIISQFINNIYMATRPQITKFYAEEKTEEMWSLVFSSAKFAYFLLYLLCLPIMLRIEDLLGLWLDNVPDYAADITRFLLIVLLIETTVNQTISVFQASNRLKHYQTTSSIILLFNVPLSFFFLKQATCVYMPYGISILLSIMYVISLLYIGKKEIGLNVNSYIKQVLCKILVVTGISVVIPFVFSLYLDKNIVSLILVFLISILSVLFSIYFYGLTDMERKYMENYLAKKLKRI